MQYIICFHSNLYLSFPLIYYLYGFAINYEAAESKQGKAIMYITITIYNFELPFSQRTQISIVWLKIVHAYYSDMMISSRRANRQALARSRLAGVGVVALFLAFFSF